MLPEASADRIALVGHSAGAHLVALVGTDPQVTLLAKPYRVEDIAAMFETELKRRPRG